MLYAHGNTIIGTVTNATKNKNNFTYLNIKYPHYHRVRTSVEADTFFYEKVGPNLFLYIYRFTVHERERR